MLKFGTDGVRGVANLDLTPEVVVALGRAAARVLGGWRFVVGRDTRLSGPLLEAALVAGLASEGVQVTVLGVAPTPAVAWSSAAHGIAGAMISASHNPFMDNGVKLFAPGGRKLTDELEAALEAELHEILGHRTAAPPRTGDAVGVVTDGSSDLLGWESAVVGSVGTRRLDGLRVVVDCANGAASEVAPRALEAIGAEVEVLHAEPDGTNINAGCGSTHPADLQRAVVERGAALGIAFDGDADRALAVDGTGRLIDGDQIIAMCAIDRKTRGLLADDTVVVTVMTNLGFRQGMAAEGIGVLEVPVGDRHVLTALEQRGLSLGGEQSGHVVFADLATTGDGLLTAVQVLDLVARSGRPLADLADAAMTRLPQVLRNVAVRDRDLDARALLAGELADAESALAATGRVLVRASGTEPLIRIMVEAPTAEQATAIADHLADVLADRAAG